MSLSFLLQATRILHLGNYTDNELKTIYEFLESIDDDMIYYYISINSVIGYNNDLELLIEIVDKIKVVYERLEEYEKCSVLKKTKEECIKIIEKQKYEKFI